MLCVRSSTTLTQRACLEVWLGCKFSNELCLKDYFLVHWTLLGFSPRNLWPCILCNFRNGSKRRRISYLFLRCVRSSVTHAIGRTRVQVACVLFMPTFFMSPTKHHFRVVCGGGEGGSLLVVAEETYRHVCVCLNICSHNSHPGGTLCSALLRVRANDGRMDGGLVVLLHFFATRSRSDIFMESSDGSFWFQANTCVWS